MITSLLLWSQILFPSSLLKISLSLPRICVLPTTALGSLHRPLFQEVYWTASNALSTGQPLWNRSNWSSTAPHCSTSPSSCPARSHPAKSCNLIFALNFSSSYHRDGGRRRSRRFLVLQSVWDRSSGVPCVRLCRDDFKISSSICFLLVLEIALCFLRLFYLLLPQVLVHCQVLLPGLLLVSSERINSQRITQGW